MPRVRLRPSTLRDIRGGANFGSPVAAVVTPPPPASTGALELAPGAIYGPHYAHVRNVLQIPFDDSIDSTHPLECFFQMPTDTVQVKSAKVWVQRKSFRAYSTTVSSGGGSTSGSGGGGTSSSGGGQTSGDSGIHDHGFTQMTPRTSGATTVADHGSHTHEYFNLDDILTQPDHTHTVANHNHTTDVHSHSTPAHAHNLTFGIFEQAAAGTLSLYVSDDGSSYGSALISGATSISGTSLTGLTTTAGDKRIKIEGTGLTRVQVLIELDLIVKVPPLA